MSFADSPFGGAPFAGEETSEFAPPPAAYASFSFRISVVEVEEIPLPITVTVLDPIDISMGFNISVVEEKDIELPIIISVRDVQPDPEVWTAIVRLAGEDISTLLTGSISVQAAEGEARIAQFQIQPPAGPLTLPNWIGAVVEIDFAEQGISGLPQNSSRIFTGVVDEPEYDFATNVVTFNCTDQLQQVIRSATREWIDTNIGGAYTEVITGEARDNLEYADARLATVPKSLDLDAYQQARTYEWNTDDEPLVTLTENDIVYESLKLKMASRGDIQNEVKIGFRYRFPRLRARVASVTFGGDIGIYTPQALDLPARSMIEQACLSLPGWSMLGEINYVPIDPGSYGGGGGTIAIVVGPADAPNLAVGFSARWASRWVQTITEDYELTIVSQPSIATIGRAARQLTGSSLDVEFDSAGWLNDTSPTPSLTYPIPVGDVSLDYGQAGKNDRGAAQDAIVVSVAQATKQILASHRITRIGAKVLLSAGIDLDKRINFDTAGLRAEGKVSRFTHSMDIDSGQADTEFEISISGFSFVGLQEDDPVEAPSAPADPTPAPGSPSYAVECGLWVGGTSTAAPWDEANMIGFSTNARQGPDFDFDGERYPFAMSIRSPVIESDVRDPITLPKAATYNVLIPQDPFELII